MKLIRQIAGCGLVMLAIVLSGWAAEPQKAPTTVASPVPADGTNPAPVMPGMFMPMAGGTNVIGTNAAGRVSPFSAEVGADFIKKVMETSAKIEEVKSQIAERQAQLYATNPDIKAIRARMIEGQKEINLILDADQELVDLKMSRDILWSTMPTPRKGQIPALIPRRPVAR